MEEIIKIEHLTKRYMIYDNPSDRLKETLGWTRKRSGREFYALKDIDFSVKKGETLAIIGENGAGKSTLLKIITGVLTPTEGSIELGGRVAALLELGTGFNPEYTGLENIYLNGNVMGFSEEDIDSKVGEIIAFADIGDFIYQKVKTYSSGMFARLAFSVAIHVEPEILIVDEALAVGDLFFQQKCNMYMKEQMKDCTKLLVTHDMVTVANMADEAIVLCKGEQVFSGDPLKAIEFYTKKAHTDLYKQKYDEADNRAYTDMPAMPEEGWVNISQEALGGALDTKILRYYFKVNGEEYCGYVQRGDAVEINFIVECHRDISKLIVGYQVKDKYGNTIFGENTHSSGIETRGIQDGKSYEASIKFSWPEIQENTYFITLGIGEGTHEMQHIIQCWAHNIIEVNAITNLPNHGLFNNRIESFRMREEN